MRKVLLILLLMLLLLVKNTYAGGIGTAGASFLKLGAGARPSALGSAYAAVDKSIYSLYWNPSGIAGIDNIQITGMHTSWIENIDYNFIGFILPLKKYTLGISSALLTMDNVEKTIETVGGGYQKVGGFSPKDYVLNISIGKEINSKINLGATLKYISSKLDDIFANALSLDFGLIYKPEIDKLQFGFAVQNIGTKLKYINKKEDLPLNIVAGAQYEFYDKFILLLDVNKYIDNDFKFHSGMEYRFKILSLRVGYNSLSDITNSITAGIGIQYKQFVIDYAFEPQGDFGDTHRFSMTVNFGK